MFQSILAYKAAFDELQEFYEVVSKLCELINRRDSIMENICIITKELLKTLAEMKEKDEINPQKLLYKISRKIKGLLEEWHKDEAYEAIIALKKLEHYILKLEETRDHFIHSLNVYLVGAICNCICFSNLDKDKRRSLDLQWLITSLFHDVGYIYVVLRHISEELSLNKVLKEKDLKFDEEFLYGMYNEITSVFGGLGGDEASLKKLFEFLIEDYKGIDLHGLASAVLTYFYIFKDNPHAKKSNWHKDYGKKLALGLLSQFLHSIDTKTVKKLFSSTVCGCNIDEHGRISCSIDLYPVILLLIMDEICEFGRPAVVSKSDKSQPESRWVLEDIALNENNVLRLRIKHNEGGNFFEEISKKILALAGEDKPMDNKIAIVLSNSRSRIINLGGDVKIEIMSKDSPPYSQSIIEIRFISESAIPERQTYIAEL